MILKERLLKVLLSPHISEKTSYNIKKKHSVVMKVLKDATKFEIKMAIQSLFKVYVKKVNLLIVKGKKKKNKEVFYKKKNWKKAYIILKSGQNLDFIENVNS